MTKFKEILFSKNFLSLELLFFVSALVYLPLIDKCGYSHDDWYLMYAAKVKGASIFREVFAGDRPLRALVMIPAYTIFGENALYFNLSAYLFRLLSGIGLFWTTRLLWAQQRRATLWIALLFLIYPGFLSLPNGIDYQSQMVALALATFSLAFTLKSLLASSFSTRYSYLAASVLFAWLYLGLVEYFIGIEVLRFLLILTLALRKEKIFLKKIKWTFFQSLPFLLAPLPFIFWRFFLFESERGATNIGAQLSDFTESPLLIGTTWAINLIHDAIKTLILAWGIPLSQFAFGMRIKETVAGFALSIIVVFLAVSMLFFLGKSVKKDNRELTKNNRWQKEAVWLGFLTLMAGLLPITLVNRSVIFPSHSRYTLIASIGVAFILVAVAYYFTNKNIRITALASLVFIATLTHHANAVSFAQERASLQDFWWQVSWRIPHIAQETTLIANYPASAIEEEYFVWGPASQIYYPEGTSKKRVRPGVYALVLTHDTMLDIITRQPQSSRGRRGIVIYPNYQEILILSQPTLKSCVHVIDGTLPEYSRWENERIMQIGEFSEVEHILTDAESHTPPEVVFGVEPAHGWCYIYQKATLARQRGDWDTVALLDQQASQNAFVPQDAIEWIPFLQASAVLGDVERVQEIKSYIKKDDFVIQQACDILLEMELTLEMRTLAEGIYCAPR